MAETAGLSSASTTAWGRRLIMRFNDTASPFQEAYAAKAIALNTTHLFLAKVEIDHSGSNDHVSFWLNPDLSGGEAGLGTPDIASAAIGTGDAFGDSLDAIRISNGADAFHEVTAPIPPPAGPQGSTVSGSQTDL